MNMLTITETVPMESLIKPKLNNHILPEESHYHFTV